MKYISICVGLQPRFGRRPSNKEARNAIQQGLTIRVVAFFVYQPNKSNQKMISADVDVLSSWVYIYFPSQVQCPWSGMATILLVGTQVTYSPNPRARFCCCSANEQETLLKNRRPQCWDGFCTVLVISHIGTPALVNDSVGYYSHIHHAYVGLSSF